MPSPVALRPDASNPTTAQAWSELTLTDVVNRAQRLQQAGDDAAAVAQYQGWIADGPPALRHVACFNLGTLLGAAHRDAEAEAAYRRAVELQPDFAHARLNLGHLFERAGQPESALAQWREVLARSAPVELRIHAWNNLGRLP